VLREDVADMEYITTTGPELSSRSLAQSYKAALAHLVSEPNARGFVPATEKVVISTGMIGGIPDGSGKFRMSGGDTLA
jgi:hypothetical protein